MHRKKNWPVFEVDEDLICAVLSYCNFLSYYISERQNVACDYQSINQSSQIKDQSNTKKIKVYDEQRHY